VKKASKKVAKRRSLSTTTRGRSHRPCSVAATSNDKTRVVQRVLALKVDVNWKDPDSKALYNRLRDLSWQAARYRNSMIRRVWAQAVGLVDAENPDDRTSATKLGRKTEKGELSGDAYSCAESEVKGAWSRDAKKILAGQPLPEWKPVGKNASALSVTGKAKQKDSGIRLEWDGKQYFLLLRAQSKDSPGGSWLRLPIAKNTKCDEHQGPILKAMLDWTIPIKKATVHVERRGITVRLSYPLELPALPPPGQRVAVLGPVDASGRLLLRTETQTKDYTSKLTRITDMKDRWDAVRRRVKAQIGRRKGHAKTKRILLARLGTQEWLDTYIHEWTRQVVTWCVSQHVGTIQIANLETLDWPAYQFRQQLAYKADEVGIKVADADLSADGAKRAVKASVSKTSRKVRKRADAIRELAHQLNSNTSNTKEKRIYE